MTGKNKPDGRTITLIRAGIINADTGKVNRNKAIKQGIVPPMKRSKTSGGGKKK